MFVAQKPLQLVDSGKVSFRACCWLDHSCYTKMSLKRKRKSASSAAQSVIHDTEGLHSVSDESRRLIFNAAAKAFGHADKAMDATSFKRLVIEEAPNVLYPLELKAVAGDPVTVYIADVRKMLHHLLNKCVNFAQVLQNCLQTNPGLCFDILLYNDEATGGNILAPDSSKKASIWYFALVQAGWLWSHVTWHPLCFIQHRVYNDIEGGFAGAAKRIIAEILNQDLQAGLPVFSGGESTLLRCKLKWMISDLDSLRAALDLKGSAGIRCCIFCKNCIKRDTSLSEYNDYFLDVTSHEFGKFQEQSDADVFEVMDQLILAAPGLSRSALKKKEICAGINFNQAGLLADKTLREDFPPSRFLLDPLHLYWSNGVVSWEVNCLFKLSQDNGLGNLKDFLSLPWKAAMPCSQSFRLTLGHESNFSGASYKGSGSNLEAFFPLFHYFLERTVGQAGKAPAAMESLRALRRVILELNSLKYSAHVNSEKLKGLEMEHQRLCKIAWGEEHMRPKHHARHHHAKQLQRIQLYLSCSPGERQHKLFKSHIGLHRFDPLARGSRNKHGDYSRLCLQAIFLHHMEELSKWQFQNGLLGKRNPADPVVVASLRNSNLVAAKKLHFDGRTISAGDVLLGLHPGIVQEVYMSERKFYIALLVMDLQETFEFHSHWLVSERTKLVPATACGRSPSWWFYSTHNTLLCLH